jgi:hypothetical protein
MFGDYIASHHLIVDRPYEAIKLNCHIIGEAHSNTKVKISATEG